MPKYQGLALLFACHCHPAMALVAPAVLAVVQPVVEALVVTAVLVVQEV
jgi:hypothetical protein